MNFIVSWSFLKFTFSKNYFRNTIRVSNGLDPDQDCRSLSGPTFSLSWSGSKIFVKIISRLHNINLIQWKILGIFLADFFKSCLTGLNIPSVSKIFAWFEVLRLSQQLWSCRDSQFTWPNHTLSWASLIDWAVNQYPGIQFRLPQCTHPPLAPMKNFPVGTAR